MSDDEDISIAELMKRKTAAAEPKRKVPVAQVSKSKVETPTSSKKRNAAEAEEDDEDVSIAELMKRKGETKKIAKVAVPAKKATTDYDSEDDDIPIAELMKKRAKMVSEANKTKAKSADKPAVKKSPAAKKSAAPSNSKSTFSYTGGQNNDSSSFYAETKKGQLVHNFLVRWWYAYSWPRSEEVSSPPAGFEALNGFTGVYVSTRTDSLGKIVDMRKHQEVADGKEEGHPIVAPTLQSLVTQPSSVLKKLCIKAYEAQLDALVEHEGSGTHLEQTLRAEMREIKKIDEAKADREGRKYEDKLGVNSAGSKRK